MAKRPLLISCCGGLGMSRSWAALLLTLCMSAFGASPTRSAPLSLALAELPAFALAQIAVAEGYFAAEGLDLKILPCVNGRACMALLANGSAQFATVGDIPVMLASHAGVPFQIVASIGLTTREHSMVVRTDRGIRVPADLKGKRIGFVSGTSSQYFTDLFLLYHGIDRHSVTMVALDPVAAPEQVARGEVDAAGLYQPQGPVALGLLGTRAVALPSPRSYASSINLIARPGVINDEVTRVLRALARAERLIEHQPARARMAIAARLRLNESAILALLELYDFRLALNQSLVTALEAESRWAIREGLVPPGTSPDFLDRLRTAPLKSVNPHAVSVVD